MYRDSISQVKSPLGKKESLNKEMRPTKKKSSKIRLHLPSLRNNVKMSPMKAYVEPHSML
jgi:hypothetical protein